MKKNSILTKCLTILFIIKSSFSRRILSESDNESSTCNMKILATYGLEGNHSPVKESNANCPNIRNNCCSNLDSKITVDLWNDDANKKISAYYETYLYSLKYILGFVEQTNELAEEMLESPRNMCKKAGEEFKRMGLTEKNTKTIFNVMVKGLKTVSNLRRGFFCGICDGDLHNDLTQHWEEQKDAGYKSIKVSKDFCETLVEKTIAAAYFEAYYIKEITEVMSVLVSCGKNVEEIEKMNYEIPEDGFKQVKNCFYYRKKYPEFLCTPYCEQFNFARASGFFDGNLEQLRKFVEFLKDNRKGGFPNGNSNFMMDVSSWEEEFLEKNFNEFGRNLDNNELFFVSQEEEYAFDRMHVEVEMQDTGGADFFPATSDSMYPLILSGVGKLSFILITILGIVLLN